MKIGTVTGTVQTSRTADCLHGQVFLTVETASDCLVATDQTGARKGDHVLVITGPAASRYCMEAPTDAAVVAILAEA